MSLGSVVAATLAATAVVTGGATGTTSDTLQRSGPGVDPDPGGATAAVTARESLVAVPTPSATPAPSGAASGTRSPRCPARRRSTYSTQVVVDQEVADDPTGLSSAATTRAATGERDGDALDVLRHVERVPPGAGELLVRHQQAFFTRVRSMTGTTWVCSMSTVTT